MGNVGRPKLEIARNRVVTVRLTDFEFQKIEKISKKLGISKTEAVVRGINLLERDKPKKFKNLSGNNKKISSGVEESDVVMFDKKN